MHPGYNPQNQQGHNNAPSPWGQAAMTSVADSSPEVRADFIRSTYVLFMAGILCAVAAGWLTASSRELFSLSLNVLRSPILGIVLIIGGSVLAQMVARTPGLNYVGLFGFTGLMGFIATPILALYEQSQAGIVGQAAFLSILVFGALTAYALISRKNFNFMGGMLFVGMIALIGAGIANVLFFKSSGMGYWLAWGSLFFSSGYVLYQTSNIVHDYTPRDNVAAALGLFISFFNIFMSLLRILGGNRN
jgi:modulator of FtsH protease